MPEIFFGKDVTDWSVRRINKLFRTHDESLLWPICGEFNVTERAIRRLRKAAQANGATAGLEYAYALNQEISHLVLTTLNGGTMYTLSEKCPECGSDEMQVIDWVRNEETLEYENRCLCLTCGHDWHETEANEVNHE